MILLILFYIKENCVAKSLRIFSSFMTVGPDGCLFWENILLMLFNLDGGHILVCMWCTLLIWREMSAHEQHLIDPVDSANDFERG